MWDVSSVSKIYIYIYIQDLCILVCICYCLHFRERTCKRSALSNDATSIYKTLYVHMQHTTNMKYKPQHKTRSRARERARARSLSLKKMLYSTSLQVQERPPKDTQLE